MERELVYLLPPQAAQFFGIESDQTVLMEIYHQPVEYTNGVIIDFAENVRMDDMLAAVKNQGFSVDEVDLQAGKLIGKVDSGRAVYDLQETRGVNGVTLDRSDLATHYRSSYGEAASI
jgi:hypothetical protein